jgi:hypothetical protein
LATYGLTSEPDLLHKGSGVAMGAVVLLGLAIAAVGRSVAMSSKRSQSRDEMPDKLRGSLRVYRWAGELSTWFGLFLAAIALVVLAIDS